MKLYSQEKQNNQQLTKETKRCLYGHLLFALFYYLLGKGGGFN